MTPTVTKRRLLYVALALILVVPAGAYLGRVALTGWAFRGALQMAGAEDIRFRVAHASPWQVVIENLDFRVRAQNYAAGRVALERPRWWQPSVGSVTVEALRVPVVIDGSDTKPWAWSTYKTGSSAGPSVKVPVEKISIDGQVVVHAAALEGKPLTVSLHAEQVGGGKWQTRVEASGEGLAVKGHGVINEATLALEFDVPEIAVDLQVWQQFIQRVVLLPGAPWEMAGNVTASMRGRVDGDTIAVHGDLHLRDGRAKDSDGRVDATGVAMDLIIDDLWAVKTRPALLTVKEARSGKLLLTDAEVEFALDSAEKIIVSRATLRALGGKVTTQPFKYFPNLRELDVTVAVEDIDVEEVMALTEDLPAQAKGRVNGELPLSIDDSGVRLGTGWLELKKDSPAEVQFNARGLLTGGVGKTNPSYAVLNKIESGLLRLRLTELRLDIRPPNAPPGRSAQLRIKGEPTDPTVKAPVNLDLNVNGPIESLIKLGLNNELSLGTKP